VELLVEASILLAASRGNATAILKDAANAYKVDTEAIATKVKQEFAAKVKAKKAAQPVVKITRKQFIWVYVDFQFLQWPELTHNGETLCLPQHPQEKRKRRKRRSRSTLKPDSPIPRAR
jgi:hypothetical protein